MFRGNQKIILFLGCTGTLGNYFVSRYASQYTIIGVARNKPKKTKSKIDFFCGDLFEDGEEIISYVLDRYKKIDAVVNNAVLYDLDKLENKTNKNFENELKVSLVGPLHIVNTIVKSFWAKEGKVKNLKEGRTVVNISSMSGLHTYPNIGQGTYSTIKAGINMLTKHMAAEYIEHGIRTNAIAPGSLQDVKILQTAAEQIIFCIEGDTNSYIRIVENDKVKVM